MPDNILTLKPDVMKHRVTAFGYSLIGGFVIAFIPFFIFQSGQVPIGIFLLLVLIIAVVIFWFMGEDPKDSYLELHRAGLRIIDGDRQTHINWTDLSRFTLLELNDGRETGEYGYSHQLIARVVQPGSEVFNLEDPVEPQDADLCIPIDGFIAHHRFTNRTKVQQEACSSAKAFANTVNRWRDFAMNIEIASISTPVIKMEEGFSSQLGRDLYFKLQK